MVSLINRTRRLRTLLGIRLGPGAAILPKDVYRINLQFAPKVDGGHMGARKFWRNMLPRLKYHNPSVSMTVDRSVPQTSSPTLTLFFHSSASPVPSTPQQQSDPNAVVKTIDMTNKLDGDIWKEFVNLSGAKEVEATEEDAAMLADLEEQRKEGEANGSRQREVNARIKREEALLRQAKIDAATND